MFVQELPSRNPTIRLTEPVVERDSRLGVEWLSGEMGKKTLELMGNVPEEIVEPSLELEANRIHEFLQTSDQLYWMIEVENKVAGAVWIDLVAKESVKAPSVHIMIGDPSVRGKGVGKVAFETVLNWLVNVRKEKTVYTRHLVNNEAAYKLISDLNFKKDGDPYTDNDGLLWQNEIYPND